MRKIAYAVALFLAAAPLAAAQEGSPARGRAFARETCSDCHAVGPAEALSPNAKAPTFRQIANTPGMTGMALTVWLLSPHPTMPNLIVKAEDINDLTAYVSTLKKRK